MSNKRISSLEMSDNECYSKIDTVPSNELAAKEPVPVKKFFKVAIVMATILNFLLVLVFGAILCYFLTNFTAEMDQLAQDNGGQSGMTDTILLSECN